MRRLCLLFALGLVCVVAGTAWGGTLSVTNPAGGTLEFGMVSVNGPAATASITVSNSGSSTQITGFTPGVGCGEFTVTLAGLPVTLGDGATATVDVSYDPANRQADTCTITINDNDASADKTFVLTGDGAAASLLVDTSAPVAFVNQRWNIDNPETKQVVVMNVGEEPTSLMAGLATGTHFSRSPASQMLAAGATVMVDVTFNPQAAGDLSDTLTLIAENVSVGAANPQVTLQGTGTQSTQAFGASPFNVGTAAVGDAVTSALAIRNDGNASLNLGGVPQAMSITGTHASDFAFTNLGCTGQVCNPTPALVNVGQSINVNIRCTPSAAGARTATLTVRSDDPASPRTVTLECTGQVPMLSTNPATAIAAFPVTQVGQASATQELTISNAAGAAPLTYSITSNSAEFQLSCPGGGLACFGRTLAAGASQVVRVTFVPAATGNRASTLTITSDDPDDNPKTINVSGTGGQPAFAAMPSPLAFGNVPVAQAGGATQALTISNSGPVALDISAMTITGDASFSFAFTGCTTGTVCNQPLSVAATSSSMITLRCDPSSAGNKTATLTVTSDAPSSPHQVSLTCTGTVPDVTVNPTMLAFGNQRVNTSSTAQSFTVSNSNAPGTAPLGYSVTETSPHYSITCTPACTGTLNLGQAATVNVTFRPTATGPQTASILVATPDDPDTTSTNVMVSGTGVEPLATLEAPAGGTLAFGNVNNGTTSAGQTITVRNTGTMNLSITGVTNTNPGDFDLAGPTTATLTPNQTASWTVACDPETRGAKTGQIRIANDSSNDTSVDVALTCTSVEGVLAVTSATPVPITGGTINFGAVRLNTMVSTTVTLTNQGNVGLTIASATLSSTTQGFSLSGLAPNTMVAAGGTTTITVTFLPTDDAHGMATLSFNTEWNDPTVNLIGDGEPTGVSVTPNPVALGSVRWDQTADQVITVRNVGTAAFSLQSATLSGTGAGEFQIVGFTPGSLTAGAMRQFTVRANPSDTMLGARTATLTVTTDLPAGMGQTTTVPLGYTSVGPAVTLTPGMTIDFGGVDVDDPDGVTVPLTIANTGDGQMTITSVGALSGTFSRTSTPANTTVAAGASHTIMVTFRPTTERDPSNPETQTFAVATTGLFAGGTSQPPSFMVTVTGYGIDRHIQVADVVFPRTYRNPTDAQVPTTTCGSGRDQPCAVRVCNTGRANLDVSMIDDPDDAFEVMAVGPFTVTAGSAATPTCMDVPIEFRPPAYGTFTGTVMVANNDNGEPMSVVALSGEGVQRDVQVSPSLVERATIAMGVPVKLSELSPGGLVLVNSSTSDSYAVHAEVAAPSVLVGSDQTIAPGQSLTYDIEIVATTPGEQSLTIDLFLDGDPLAHPGPGNTLTIPIEVVEIDVHGGGCDGGGGGASLLVGLVAVGLLAVRRRRGVAPVALAVVVVVGGSAAPARADVTRNLDLGTFTPTPSTEPGMFQVVSPEVASKGAWALIVGLSHAVNPMVAEWMQDGAEQQLELVAARSEVELGFAYALSDRLELAARLPMYQQTGGTVQMADPIGLSPAGGFALGDVAVRAKATALKGAVGFGGALEITAPTAKDGQFAGVDLPTAHLQALLGGHSRRVEWALNVGFLARQSAAFSAIEQGSELTYGAGVAVRVLDKVALVGETYGSVGVIGAEGKVSPFEWAAGLRVRASRSLVVGFGGGTGLGQGLGVPDARAFLTLAIAPRARVPEPLKIVVPPPPRDTRDDDGDGVVNADDACPLDAEDADGHDDGDGCPDPDNDGDGFLDAADKCPAQAEDKDGFQDDDGCPDADNDGDGIPDVDDKCPMEPEDRDGFNDNDGCDDPDNDNDGVPDVLDQCALEPETINGNADEDGCPDKGDALVMLMQDRIEVLEPVTFTGLTPKLAKGSTQVLAQVGATMRAEQSLKRVRVTVHVHPRGNGDEALSEKRAEEIRKWLISWGVEPERIEAKGIGSKRPLVPKKQKGAEQINDRVEFIILERR